MNLPIKKIYNKYVLKEESLFQVCFDLSITANQLEIAMYRICLFNFGTYPNAFLRALRMDKIKSKSTYSYKSGPYRIDLDGFTPTIKQEIKRAMYNQYKIIKKYVDQAPDTMRGLIKMGYNQYEVAKIMFLPQSAVSKYKDLDCRKSTFVKKAIAFHKENNKDKDKILKAYRKKALEFIRTWYKGRIIANKTQLVLEKAGVLELVLDNKIEEAKQRLLQSV